MINISLKKSCFPSCFAGGSQRSGFAGEERQEGAAGGLGGLGLCVGVDENGEPAERHLASQSRDAARRTAAFWEGDLCLSGSQGNNNTPVNRVRVGGIMFQISDWPSSSSSGLIVSLRL